ncbi:MAG: hypothetical protein NZ533_04970 [Casimicrobiaceae bacterium]|nr:hypothetical protein [Casimicrobiaceae bacterium]MDW8312527.1 hypothetical protein [Burkholderiales bacterium]
MRTFPVRPRRLEQVKGSGLALRGQRLARADRVDRYTEPTQVTKRSVIAAGDGAIASTA